MVLGEKHGTNYLPYTNILSLTEVFFTYKNFHRGFLLDTRKHKREAAKLRPLGNYFSYMIFLIE